MTSFENFHAQFLGLVERAMLSELEDMLRIIGQHCRHVDSATWMHAERAAEALHAARRRGRDPCAHVCGDECDRLGSMLGGPRFRLDAPPRSNADIEGGGNLPV